LNVFSGAKEKASGSVCARTSTLSLKDQGACKMSKSPSFQFYPKDFLSDLDVALMGNAELGAYIRLMCYEWIENGLPSSETELRKISQLSKQKFTNFFEVFEKKFQLVEKKFIHPRLEQERVKQLNNSKIRRKAAQERWNKNDANALPEESLSPSSSISSSASLKKDKSFSNPLNPPCEEGGSEISKKSKRGGKRSGRNKAPGFLKRLWLDAGHSEEEFMKRVKEPQPLSVDDIYCLDLAEIDREKKKNYLMQAKALIGAGQFNEELHMLKSRMIEGAVKDPDKYFNKLIEMAIQRVG
jgi:uncharacterized protein YdaU (DUF1376 family)